MSENLRSLVVGGSAEGPKAAARIREELRQEAARRRVLGVRVGLIYTAVQLDTGALGVAYTFPRSGACGAARVSREGRRAADLVVGLGGEDSLAATIALATVNALLAGAPPPPETREVDVLDSLDIRRGDRVCMVGCFIPLLRPLEELGVELETCDRTPRPGSGPAEEAEKQIPGSQVAIITATSLINNTLDRLLDLASCCREVVLLGASTPLLPRAFAGTPVTSLSGIRVREPEGVLASISEGQGFRVFKRYVDKVSLRLGPPHAGAPASPGGPAAKC